MYVDRHNRYSDAQAITASAASEDVLDMGIERRLGTGEDIYLVAIVDVAFTDTGSDSTVTITLESDATEAFPSATTVFTLGTFGALSAIGARLIAKLPPEQAFEQFHRLQYTVANGNLTTGSITAFLTKDIAAFTAYASGYTVT